MCIKVFSQTYEQLQTLQVQKTSNSTVMGGGGRKKKKSKKMPEALQQYARLFCLIATHNSFRVIICCGMTNILHLKLLYLLRDEAKHS